MAGLAGEQAHQPQCATNERVTCLYGAKIADVATHTHAWILRAFEEIVQDGQALSGGGFGRFKLVLNCPTSGHCRSKQASVVD